MASIVKSVTGPREQIGNAKSGAGLEGDPYCLSFLLCQCVHAFAFLFDFFGKLGVNFGIYATSLAMQPFIVWLAAIRTRTCSSVGQGEAGRVGWG